MHFDYGSSGQSSTVLQQAQDAFKCLTSVIVRTTTSSSLVPHMSFSFWSRTLNGSILERFVLYVTPRAKIEQEFFQALPALKHLHLIFPKRGECMSVWLMNNRLHLPQLFKHSKALVSLSVTDHGPNAGGTYHPLLSLMLLNCFKINKNNQIQEVRLFATKKSAYPKIGLLCNLFPKLNTLEMNCNLKCPYYTEKSDRIGKAIAQVKSKFPQLKHVKLGDKSKEVSI